MIIKTVYINNDCYLDNGSEPICLYKEKKLPKETFQGNENIILVANSSNNNNYYTYLIGNNGVGKTSLLNVLSGYGKNGLGVSCYFESQDPIEQPFTLYIGNGLFQNDAYKNNNSNLLTFDPNRASLQHLCLNLLSRNPDGAKQLQDFLKMHIESIEISLAFEEFSEGRSFGFILSHKKTKDISCFWRSFNLAQLINESETLKYLYSLFNNNDNEFYPFVNSILSDFIGCLEELSPLRKGNFYRKSRNNIVNDTTCRFVDIVNKHIVTITAPNFDQKTLLLLLFLEEQGWVKVRITVKKEGKDEPFQIYQLSNGEKMIIKFFSFFAELPTDKRENLLILYDEPENSLHPQWQIEFPKIFTSIVSLYNISCSHCIIATHSPLIVVNASKCNNNTCIVNLFLDEKNILRSQFVVDPKHFSAEGVLANLFGVSFYTDEEIKKLKRKLRIEDRDLDKKTLYSNRLKEVERSIAIKENIDNLYKEIFP